jgi:23S rRNA (pseudouridine1915-N3)-methyltransferase
VKITVSAVGRLKEPYLVDACAEYEKRLRPYCTLAVTEAKDEAAMLAALPANAHVYAFDERGELVTSAQLAELVAGEQAHGGGAPVVFAIGGADGHGDVLRARANDRAPARARARARADLSRVQDRARRAVSPRLAPALDRAIDLALIVGRFLGRALVVLLLVRDERELDLDAVPFEVER